MHAYKDEIHTVAKESRTLLNTLLHNFRTCSELAVQKRNIHAYKIA